MRPDVVDQNQPYADIYCGIEQKLIPPLSLASAPHPRAPTSPQPNM